MNLDRKIWSHLIAEQRNEEAFARAYAVDDTTTFVYIKLKELYWTLTRLLGPMRRRKAPAEPSNRKRPILTEARLGEGAFPTAAHPRMLIDVTPTHRFARNTGIQRVVREISKLAFEAGLAVPVVIEDGRLLYYFDHPSLPSAIDIVDGDKLLLADSSWELIDEYLAIIPQVSAKGGKIIVGLYDIIPLLYPFAVSPEAAALFNEWLEKVVLKSDAVMCISEWTAMQFNDYITKNNIPNRQGLRIGWWRLGADFELDAHHPPSSRAIAVMSQASPFFLSVGTLEPRKGYSAVLSVFEKLWSDNVDVRYVIVGRQGGRAKALEARITSHKEYGRRLIWIDDANDADLRHYYKHARALIFASVAEGFGLPLVEALHHGLPAIVSDLPVFHDIGGDDVRYFGLLDEASLTREVTRAMESPKPEIAVPSYTWRESVNSLLHIIREDRYQLRRFGGNTPGVVREPFATAHRPVGSCAN